MIVLLLYSVFLSFYLIRIVIATYFVCFRDMLSLHRYLFFYLCRNEAFILGVRPFFYLLLCHIVYKATIEMVLFYFIDLLLRAIVNKAYLKPKHQLLYLLFTPILLIEECIYHFRVAHSFL